MPRIPSSLPANPLNRDQVQAIEQLSKLWWLWLVFGVAWTLIAVGAGILAVSALWAWIEAWLAADIPWLLKLASGALAVGIALLVVSVLRERWVLSRRDPYAKEIER